MVRLIRRVLSYRPPFILSDTSHLALTVWGGEVWTFKERSRLMLRPKVFLLLNIYGPVDYIVEVNMVPILPRVDIYKIHTHRIYYTLATQH